MIPKERQALIDIFVQRNSQINLSAIREPEAIYVKHILDSLELNKIVDLNSPLAPLDEGGMNPAKRGKGGNISCLDLWTGWGFPLLPLAITHPNVQFTWLDARKKKLTAIDDMIQHLGLDNVKTVWSRVEDHAPAYNYIVTRAVGYSDKLLPRILPRLQKWWIAFLYKLFTEEEDTLILDLIRKYNLTLAHMYHYSLPWDTTERIIYGIQK